MRTDDAVQICDPELEHRVRRPCRSPDGLMTPEPDIGEDPDRRRVAEWGCSTGHEPGDGPYVVERRPGRTLGVTGRRSELSGVEPLVARHQGHDVFATDDEYERLDDPGDLAAHCLSCLGRRADRLGKRHDLDFEAGFTGGLPHAIDRCGHGPEDTPATWPALPIALRSDDPHPMRVWILAVALIVSVLGACSSESDDSSAVARPAPIGVPIEGSVDVAYAYQPGAVLRYDLAVTQDIEYEVSGDPSFLASTSDPLPSGGRVTSRASTEIEYEVAATSTEQAATIAISATFPDPETTAFADGRALDPEIYDELTRALAVIQPIEFTVGVNDRNAVLTSGGLGGLDVLSGEVGALTNLSNNQISRPLGPVFPEGRVLAPGDQWSIDSVREAPSGPVVVSTDYEVIALTEIEGRPHLTISSMTQTDGFDLDFSDIFRSLFAGFAAGEDDIPLEEADLEAFSDVVFAIGVQPSTGTAEYLFDVESGRVVSTSQQSTVRTRWLLQTPDDATGEPAGFELTLDINRRADFRHIDG